jgi:hypothetical protein
MVILPFILFEHHHKRTTNCFELRCVLFL